MLSKRTVHDLDVRNRRVFVRVDFNVPIDDASIGDDTRIRAAIPTIRLLLDKGARVVLASHLGRPKEHRDPIYSLAPIAVRLGELLGSHVAFASDCVGESATTAVAALDAGQVVLIENLRYHDGEQKNDNQFVSELAKLADIYVNDAFGTAHRAHASTVGLPSVVQPAAAGLLMERELDYLGRALHDPERPFYAVLGGAKVSDKIGIISNLMKVADAILIGGAMAYTFLAAMNRRIGDSLVECDKVDDARDIMIEALQRGVPLYLPVDHVVAQECSATSHSETVWRDGIHDGWEGLDIGPGTQEMYVDVLRRAKLIVWNGPLGVYEIGQFSHGTIAVAKAMADLDATTIVGGGDCVAAVHRAGVADRLSHISTGGGASLQFLEGRELPGVAALTDA